MEYLSKKISWYWILFCLDPDPFQSSVWIRIRNEFFRSWIWMTVNCFIQLCPDNLLFLRLCLSMTHNFLCCVHNPYCISVVCMTIIFLLLQSCPFINCFLLLCPWPYSYWCSGVPDPTLIDAAVSMTLLLLFSGVHDSTIIYSVGYMTLLIFLWSSVHDPIPF